MRLPVVTRTVHFGSPLTGTQLIGLVQGQANVAVLNRQPDGRVETGQRSCYPCRNLRVSPTLECPFLDPAGEYDSCLIETHLWARSRYPIGYDSDVPVRDLDDFARRLQRSVTRAIESPDAYPTASAQGPLAVPGWNPN